MTIPDAPTNALTGSLLTRRRLLGAAGIGAAAAATIASPSRGATLAATTTSCSGDTSEQEVGPFYVAEGLVRSDVTGGQTGIPLTITLTFTNNATCGPLVGAAVEIWHANASGVYSDESSESTVGQKWLRGTQITDANGQVTFTTIYPGWYSGRTEHIHHRVYTGGSVSGATYSYSGATLIHTGQLFFDTATNDAVAASSTYSANGTARTTNASDRVYTQQSGSLHVLALTGSTGSGYTGTATIAVNASGSSSMTTHATALSIGASSAGVTAGTSIVVSGLLTDSTTASPLANQPVTITAVTANGATATKTTTTDSTGRWAVTVTPARTVTYRASFAGASGYAPSKSSAVTVGVAHRVTFTSISGPAAASRPIVAKGRIVPADKGVTVRIRTTTSSGPHTLVAVKTASDGTWKASWKMRVGRHKVFAVAAATKADTLAGTSRTITVHRD